MKQIIADLIRLRGTYAETDELADFATEVFNRCGINESCDRLMGYLNTYLYGELALSPECEQTLRHTLCHLLQVDSEGDLESGVMHFWRFQENPHYIEALQRVLGQPNDVHIYGLFHTPFISDEQRLFGSGDQFNHPLCGVYFFIEEYEGNTSEGGAHIFMIFENGFPSLSYWNSGEHAIIPYDLTDREVAIQCVDKEFFENIFSYLKFTPSRNDFWKRFPVEFFKKHYGLRPHANMRTLKKIKFGNFGF